MTPIRNVSDRERQLQEQLAEAIRQLDLQTNSAIKFCSERNAARIERDELRAELAKLKHQEPQAWLITDCIGEKYLCFTKPPLTEVVEPLFLAAGAQGHTREQCPTCGEDEPFTGSCGTSSNDTKALCKRTALPHAHSSELKPYPLAPDRREGLGAHHVYCRALGGDV